MKSVKFSYESTSSKITNYSENPDNSNQSQELEKTNDHLFKKENILILNKRTVKTEFQIKPKLSLNRTFPLKLSKLYKESDDINIEKWYRNKIIIEKVNNKTIYNLYKEKKCKLGTNLLKAIKEFGVYNIFNDGVVAAKIKWNFFSNHFKVYDAKGNIIEEIIYSFNFKGWNGPTKLSILLPKDMNKTKDIKKNINMKIFHKIENKTPEYNDIFNIYTLKFIDRHVIPNEKNIQVIYKDYKEDSNNILLQFAQSKNNEYILDYKYPFDYITSFSLAISLLSSRTFCK